METARAAVEVAAKAALVHWRTPLLVERKADATPVTAADHDAEAAILTVLRAAYPEHGILSEESGAFPSGASSRWIVDPIDGTRGFARGGTFWGPIVALERDGAIVAGAMALPALGATYWAGRGCGAYCNGRRIVLSQVTEWSEATLSVGEMRVLLASRWRQGIVDLVASASSTRSYGDVAGCAQHLDGRAEAWLEAGVKPWDIAALKVLVVEAGGRCSVFDGNDTHTSGSLAATNGLVHARVLAALGRV